MAALNQQMVALVARHRDGVGRLLARSRFDPSRLVILIAHLESAVGKSFLEAGLAPAPGRSSLVVPTDRAAVRMFTDVLEQPEVRLLAEKHEATPILVFTQGDVGVTFERFGASLTSPLGDLY